MSNKPKIYGYCASGCKWEVPHKSDLPKRFEYLTKAEYEALTEYDDEVMYCVYDEDWVVEEAEVAQYASDDFTKGTIEERLEALGFKVGAFEIDGNSSATLIVNNITKQGKHALANLEMGDTVNTVKLNIPSDFLPKETTKLMLAKLNLTYGFYLVYYIYLGTDGKIYADEELTTEYEFNGVLNLVNCGWRIA